MNHHSDTDTIQSKFKSKKITLRLKVHQMNIISSVFSNTRISLDPSINEIPSIYIDQMNEIDRKVLIGQTQKAWQKDKRRK